MRAGRGRFGLAGLAVVASAALWSDASPAAGDARRAARDAGCLLFSDRARTSTSAACLACHGKGGSAQLVRSCHPVGIDYAGAARTRAALRPIEEVVRRGVFLPDRELRCVTCHDQRSPWAHAVALPPGAVPTRAVDAARPAERGPGPPPAPPGPGDRVSSKPLCLACHVLD